MAWTLLFQSCIPFCYWGDCVLNTAYLINCTPSPLLSNKTLFELLNNNKPTYNHFCTFGCLCYAFTFSNQRTKFSSHAWASVFLGYHFGYMSYKLLDLESNKVYISRNVIFHESLLLFAYFSMSNDVVDLVSDCVIPKPIHSIYEPSCSQLSMSFPYSPESISSPTPIQTCSHPHHVVTKLVTCLIIIITSLNTFFPSLFYVLFLLAWVTTSFPSYIVNLFSPLVLKLNQHHSPRPLNLKMARCYEC